MADTQEVALTLGAMIDHLYELRNSRILLDRESKELKEQETALKTFIIDKLKQDGSEGNRGQLATCSIIRSREAAVLDWQAYMKFLAGEEAWELVQQRVSITALRERWDAGQEIPGVEMYEKEDLSVAKAAAKKVR